MAAIDGIGTPSWTIQPGRAAEGEADDQLDWVLPSSIDCHGQPAPPIPFSVWLRQRLSLGALRTAMMILSGPP